ncbi:MAG: PAS domain-containing protein [Myxococcales bacterium]|nr:PAS domain-containing protein [Myxococcales bacterium]
MTEALERFIAQFKGGMADAFIDSWFIVDQERTIVEFNRAFFSLLPRQVARGLKGKKCYEVLELDICKERCIAEQCWKGKQHVRLDEITGRPAQTEQPMRFVLSAIPILDEAGNIIGALEVQRNVTDEAVVQTKYQDMLDHEARERERLAGLIRSRTKELLDTNQTLLRVQKELVAHKKGLAV